MASDRSLLHRLEHPSAPERQIRASSSDLQAYILEHLQQMLNTRQGSSNTVPDYGTPDFSDFFRGYDSVQVFREEVRRVIEKYEPRLVDVRVTADQTNDLFSMCFKISAVMHEDGELETISFSTVIKSSGEVTIS